MCVGGNVCRWIVLVLCLWDSGDTDTRQHSVIKITIILFLWLCVSLSFSLCVCRVGGCIFISKPLLFGLHYDTVMNYAWHKSLKISFKHETSALVYDSRFLHVSSVSSFISVLWCTGPEKHKILQIPICIRGTFVRLNSARMLIAHLKWNGKSGEEFKFSFTQQSVTQWDNDCLLASPL